MLTIEGQKMSKSCGNFVTLFDVFKKFDPLTIRYFIAASHYRSLVDFSESSLTSAGISLNRLHQTVQNLRERKAKGAKPTGKYFEEYRKRFCKAMDDDFSTPQALAVLFELSRDVNTLLSEKRVEPEVIVDAEHLFSSLGGNVLGIIPESLETSQTELQIKNVMEVLVELRKNFRENEDFVSADLIRERLHEIGIEFKDFPEGTTWELTDKN